MAVQEFGEQNPLLAKQLGSSLSKLTELHAQTSRLAEGRPQAFRRSAFGETWLKAMIIFAVLFVDNLQI